MKYQIVFLVSLACVLIATEANPTKVCEPGTVVKKDCNDCKCNTDGTDMACTRKICTGKEDGVAPGPDAENAAETAEHAAEPAAETAEKSADPAPEKAEAKDDSEHCTPGETFKKDCNDCTCPPSGLKSAGACTLLACLDDEISKD